MRTSLRSIRARHRRRSRMKPPPIFEAMGHQAEYLLAASAADLCLSIDAQNREVLVRSDRAIDLARRTLV